MNQLKNIATIVLMSVTIFGLSFWGWGKEADDFSESERRVLAAFPELSTETILNGKFMSEFEDYAMDQFPMRDIFRGIKSASVLGAFSQLDNNDLYIADGYISKMEYPLNEKMLDYASERFQFIYDSYIAGTDANVYLSVIPDKNYFLAKESGRLSLDYEKLISYMQDKNSNMSYIDITELLSLEDYYRTDTHWRQEKISDVAAELAAKMGVPFGETYAIETLDHPFYGVYYGQLALPVEPDEIQYVMNDTLKNCVVTYLDTGMPIEGSIYDMEKAYGKDPYEMYLSGATALVTIENPNASTEKELIVFRDSFAGSLIPYLVEGYQKITLVDIRYVDSKLLGAFLKVDNQDVLYLYSTILLNNSLGLK